MGCLSTDFNFKLPLGTNLMKLGCVLSSYKNIVHCILHLDMQNHRVNGVLLEIGAITTSDGTKWIYHEMQPSKLRFSISTSVYDECSACRLCINHNKGKFWLEKLEKPREPLLFMCFWISISQCFY